MSFWTNVLIFLLVYIKGFFCFNLHSSFGRRGIVKSYRMSERSDNSLSEMSARRFSTPEFLLKDLEKDFDNDIDYDDDEEVVVSSNTAKDPSNLSKNELKRRRQASRREELKAAFGTPTEKNTSPRIGRRQNVTDHYLATKNNSFSIAIDCSWENIHTEEDLKHLENQLTLSYSINRKHSHPADLRITGVGPRLSEILKHKNAYNWSGVPITSQNYSEVDILTSDSITSGPVRKKTLVYLSPDAPYVLSSLDPSCCYIVGGIIDRSVRKYLTTTKAHEERLPCARLPIKEHFKVGRTALTINQVVEILLNYAKTQDWYTAMEPVIPKRKIGN